MSKNLKLYLIVISCIILSTWYLCTYPEHYTVCGTVVDKISTNEGYTYKRHTRVTHKRYLVVKFEDRYEDVNVTTDTYYKSGKGDRVCFERREITPAWHIAVMIVPIGIGILGTIVFISTIIMFIFACIFDSGSLREYAKKSFLPFGVKQSQYEETT